MAKERDIYLQAMAVDNSLPIDPDAIELWARDLDNPLRWSVMPWLRLFLAVFLHLTWAFKRMSPIQFSAHRYLQFMICWFCKHFVSPEGNRLILRHFATESNILNFIIDNTKPGLEPLKLYPSMLADLMTNTFVDHDQELFRVFRDLGSWEPSEWPKPHSELKWDHWREIDVKYDTSHKKWTQVLDFETGHVLFMCMFCLFLTREEYRGAINGFNLDQSMALRIAKMVDDPSIIEMAYNKYPMYLLGPWNLTQRFLMHGFFTEHLNARLEQIRQQQAA